MTSEVGTDIRKAAGILRDGGLVAFATETVYGLGGNALDVNAVARIFEAKARPKFDPLIVHIHDTSQVSELVQTVSVPATDLMERFWPGPLTLVMPKQNVVPDLVTAGLPSVALRMPAHPMAMELIEQAGVPVAAPSANPFGCLSPTRVEHVADQLGNHIDYILDGGACPIGVESTVVGFPDGSPVLLRPGGLPLEEIEAAIGPVQQIAKGEVSDNPSETIEATPQISPGLLSRHYAPNTPLITRDEELEIDVSKLRVGLLTFKSGNDVIGFTAVEVLSEQGNLVEAATNFFVALRKLDNLSLDLILADRFPEYGLGRALNDRLHRAAKKR